MAQENKKLNQRKIVPNNSNGTEEDPKKRPKFNIYWIYGLLLAAIIGFNYFKNVGSAGVETDIEAFKEIVKQGDISEIKVIRNKKIVRVFINKDSIRACLIFFKIFSFEDVLFIMPYYLNRILNNYTACRIFYNCILGIINYV